MSQEEYYRIKVGDYYCVGERKEDRIWVEQFNRYFMLEEGTKVDASYCPCYSLSMLKRLTYGMKARLLDDYYSLHGNDIVYIAESTIDQYKSFYDKVKVAIVNEENKSLVYKKVPLSKLTFYPNIPCKLLWHYKGYKSDYIGMTGLFIGWLDHMDAKGVTIKKHCSNNTGIYSLYTGYIYINDYCFIPYESLKQEAKDSNNIPAIAFDYSGNMPWEVYYSKPLEVTKTFISKPVELSEEIVNKTKQQEVDLNNNLYGWIITTNPHTGESDLRGEVCNQADWSEVFTKMIDLKDLGEEEVNKLKEEVTQEQNKEIKVQRIDGKWSSLEVSKVVLPTKTKMFTEIENLTPKAMFDSFTIKDFMDSTKASLRVEGESIVDGTILSKGFGVGTVVPLVELRKGLPTFDYIIHTDTTLPNDVDIMKKSKGIIVSTGSPTCHAAIICNQYNIPCILCNQWFNIKEEIILYEGSVYRKNTSKITSNLEEDVISSKIRGIIAKKLTGYQLPINVKMNADNIDQIKLGMANGCEKVGLYRVEHSMLGVRAEYVRDLLEYNKTFNFSKVLKSDISNILYNCSLTQFVVRSLDAPAHEFLPNTNKESNPMLGWRGTRTLLTCWDHACAHLTAIKDSGFAHRVTFELPMVSSHHEVKYMSRKMEECNLKPENLAVMIETPAACFEADKMTKFVTEFSFGTNDLTQMVLGISRDDSNKFMEYYSFLNNPFTKLHDNVLEIMKIAIDNARRANPLSKFTVCGEQGSDIESIIKAKSIGVDAVSISPSKILDVKYQIGWLKERGEI